MRNIAILSLLLACAVRALAGTFRADEIPNVQRMDRRRYVSDPVLKKPYLHFWGMKWKSMHMPTVEYR